MARSSDYECEMNDHDLDEAQIEALLTGQAGDPVLTDALSAIRSSYLAGDLPPISSALIEFVDVSLIVDKGDLLVTAASKATGPVTQAAALPRRRDALKRRRKRMISAVSSFVGTVIGRTVVGATVAMAATGGAQAVGVINVPILPSAGPAPVVQVADRNPPPDLAVTPTDSDSEPAAIEVPAPALPTGDLSTADGADQADGTDQAEAQDRAEAQDLADAPEASEAPEAAEVPENTDAPEKAGDSADTGADATTEAGD